MRQENFNEPFVIWVLNFCVEVRGVESAYRVKRLIADDLPATLYVEHRVDRQQVKVFLPLTEVIIKLPATFHGNDHLEDKRRVARLVLVQIEIVNATCVRHHAQNVHFIIRD